jgi:thiol-disulfide isomerase/thioredoxin
VRFFFVFSIVATLLYCGTFFNLEGIKGYDIVVVDSTRKLDNDIVEEMREAMYASARRLGIDTRSGHSTVLAAIITLFSLNKETGVRLDLELGEYFERKRINKRVFALSYVESKTMTLEQAQEEAADMLEEMLDAFERQYRADNTAVTSTQNRHALNITHENFATAMGYETDYLSAVTKAKKANKPLLLYMRASYCPWCRKLEQRILIDADINRRIHERFVPVRLNYADKNYPAKFAEIPITPTLYIVDWRNDTIMERFVGYNDREAFLHYLRTTR